MTTSFREVAADYAHHSEHTSFKILKHPIKFKFGPFRWISNGSWTRTWSIWRSRTMSRESFSATGGELEDPNVRSDVMSTDYGSWA